MKRYDRITPAGTRDLLFAECENRRETIEALRQLFETRGYRQITTPGFEFYDVFSASEMYFPQETMFKLFDDQGRILVARPDTTIPIARLVATRLKDHPLPLRLYYEQNVFRRTPDLRGHSNEIMQMGVELIGAASREADLEILQLGAAALADSGAGRYRLELGHVGIFQTLMERLNARPEDRATIHELIAAKNYAALSNKLDRFGDLAAARMLRELPRLFGGEEAFPQAAALFGADPVLGGLLEALHQVFREVCAAGYGEHLIVDLGLVNQADYYSSLVFRGYIAEVGAPVLSGGRYDKLLANFGSDLPAIGLSIHVDQLAADRRKQEERGASAGGASADGGSTAGGTLSAGGSIGGALSDGQNRRLRLALTKGRLEEETIELFENMGIDCAELRDKGRRLWLTLTELDLDVVFAKAADVITYVEHGACDLGVVGLDTILENGGTFYEVLDLGFGACRFALAAPADTDFYGGLNAKRIATKYPGVARTFFEDRGMDVQVIKIEGSVELAPLLDLADGIVDIVSTGTTLRENGLNVVDDIRAVSARLIVNEASLKLRKTAIDTLTGRMEQAVLAAKEEPRR